MTLSLPINEWVCQSALFANNLFCYDRQCKPCSDAFHAALI